MRIKQRENVFFSLLFRQAEQANKAARIFHKMTEDFSDLQQQVGAIHQIESDADELTHELANRADATFITPIDKEDLRALSSSLDDITDVIEACASRMIIYRVTTPRPDFEPAVRLLVEATEEICGAVKELGAPSRRSALQPRLIRIHELENASDSMFRRSLGELFGMPNPDVLEVFKWKEIYDRVEMAMDRCEDVAKLIESVVMKYA